MHIATDGNPPLPRRYRSWANCPAASAPLIDLYAVFRRAAPLLRLSDTVFGFWLFGGGSRFGLAGGRPRKRSDLLVWFAHYGPQFRRGQ